MGGSADDVRKGPAELRRPESAGGRAGSDAPFAPGRAADLCVLDRPLPGSRLARQAARTTARRACGTGVIGGHHTRSEPMSHAGDGRSHVKTIAD
ncbi:hypothetical protein GCM10010104_54700 [Streptomyces indiaensis]|uniref:Amidohydrolase family protein n=1 Tax=Streptomyces indiaensis TaxID=284033 RepID=A0ABN3E9L4_9ACTN